MSEEAHHFIPPEWSGQIFSPRIRRERNTALVTDLNTMGRDDVQLKYQLTKRGLSVILNHKKKQSEMNCDRVLRGNYEWKNKRVRDYRAPVVECSKCKKEKSSDDFPSLGLICIECNDYRIQDWQKRNRASISVKTARWIRKKRKTDVSFRLYLSIRSGLVRALSGAGAKKGFCRTEIILGLSRWDFKKHIESLWLPGMTWENRTQGVWHIDHIMPASIFDHRDPRQVSDCWHYTNLRPLWGIENMRKHDKVIQALLPGPQLPAGILLTE